jgi:transcriptional regulator with XRE-family HTH domain
MNEISERLKLLRTNLHLSIREFSKQIYLSRSLYDQIEIGHREITDRILQLISSRFNVSKEWILKGEGEMFTAPPPDMKLARLIEIYNTLDGLMQECLLEQSDVLLKIHRAKNGKENQ